MKKWLILWLVLGMVALAGSAAIVFWWPPERETHCEIALRRGLADNAAWDALAGIVSRHFAVERSEKEAADGTGVLYTGWVTRMHDRDFGGKQVRVMVVLDRSARRVRLTCEAQSLSGQEWKPASDDGLLVQLAAEVRQAVGERPAGPT